jgi:hypothetical protein
MGIVKKKYSRGGLLAPNGKPSNLNATQYELVRSKEFKDWFGDWEKTPSKASKVVDENGEPLVVYHGTNVEFYEFDLKYFGKTDKGWYGKGFYFTPNRNFTFARDMVEQFGGKEVKLELFLNIKNPFYGEAYAEQNSNLVGSAKDMDRDGVIVLYDYGHELERQIAEIVVWESNQIKLANGTNTTFDSKNPDIRFEKGGNIKKYNRGGLTNAEINDKIMEVEKKFWGDIKFSGYHDTDGVLVRLKDHPARWSNFIEYNTEKKSGSNTDYKFLSIIISDDVKLYDVEENVQKFYDEYLDDFPNAEAKEIVLPSDTSVDEIIEEIEYEVRRMNKPKKLKKGGILRKKDNVGWTIFGTIALIVTLGKVNALKK